MNRHDVSGQAPGAPRLALEHEVRGAGEPVLFISGANDTRRGWDMTAPALEDTFACVVFDNRDAGTSPRAEADYTLADMAADTAGVLDRAGLASAHVVGHSLGSAIAQELCLGAPERVRSLTLIGSWARTDEYVRAMMQMWLDWSHTLDDERFATSCALFWFGESAIRSQGMDAIARECVTLLQAQGRDAFRRQIRAAMAHDALDRLGAIGVPTQVVWGEQERVFSHHHARQLASAIPGATLVCIPAAGHCCTVEAPEPVNAALRAFLLRL